MELKDFKKILVDQREEYQRYLKVSLEEQSSQIKLLAEGIHSNGERLDSNAKMIAKNAKMIAKNSVNIEIIKSDVSKNTENIEIIKSDISFIKGELKQKADLEEFRNLEKRVILLEKRLA